MSDESSRQAAPDEGAASPRPGEPYVITFDEIQLQNNGETVWTLRQCGKCSALVVDTQEAMQTHVNWHGQLRQETTMASLGFGGLGL
jgi:hypothetical protein